MRVGLVFGGAAVRFGERVRRLVAQHPDALVVAADSGAAGALACGRVPDVVVGDLDSIDEETLAELRRLQVPVEPFPRDKDYTDGQLAAERALALGAERLILLGYLGGPRLDHALGNVFLLAALPPGTKLVDDQHELALLRGGESLTWAPESGELVSLLPAGVDAVGVTTAGLRWQLDNAQLLVGQTRGISNEPVLRTVTAQLDSGRLIVSRHFPVTTL